MPMTPLDAAHQATLAAHPHCNDIIAAIDAAGIGFENNNVSGFQANGDDAVAAAQAIIDTEASWLPQAAARVTQAVLDAYAARLSAGRIYAVAGVAKTYQIDPTSQQNIASAGMMAQAASMPGGAAWPSPGLAWIALDNTETMFGAADFIAFATDVGAYVTGLVLARRTLKNAVLAATTAAALDAVDTEAGWPANQ